MNRLMVSLIVATTLYCVGSTRADDTTQPQKDSGVGLLELMEQMKNDHRFNRLWNDCRPLDLSVPGLSEHAVAIGLTKEKVANSVRRRLRAFHIEDEDDTSFYIDGYLQVRLAVSGISFAVIVEYMDILHKYLGSNLDEYVPLQGSAYQTVSVGSHFGKAEPIMQRVSKQTDHFIEEYLRVNGKFCGR